jgi:hypothetical protein
VGSGNESAVVNGGKGASSRSHTSGGDQDKEQHQSVAEMKASAAAMFTGWPLPGSAHRDISQAPVMARLVSWVEGLVSFATELAAKGGPARPVTKRSPPGLFAAVVPVKDAEDRLAEENELSTKGWR